VGVNSTEMPYIAMLDADDRPKPDFLSVLLHELIENDLDAIKGICITKACNNYFQTGLAWEGDEYENSPKIVKMTNMVGRPALYKTETLKEVGIDPKFSFGSEDTDLSYAFELKGKKQAIGTGISERFFEERPILILKKMFQYGMGYAQFSHKYPEKRITIIKHILINISLLRPFNKKFPLNFKFLPFFILYSCICFMGFIYWYIAKSRL
jgi:glycosyltransferase involved in cell wall biosynthesis